MYIQKCEAEVDTVYVDTHKRLSESEKNTDQSDLDGLDAGVALTCDFNRHKSFSNDKNGCCGTFT